MDILRIIELGIPLVGGGGLVTVLWSFQASRRDTYRELDLSYRQLLNLYLENPEFSDEKAISRLSDNAKYHCFAMTVHSFTETLFDLYRKKIANHRVWGKIFCHHVKLHGRWLLRNASLQEDEYLQYILDSKLLSGEALREGRESAA